MKKKKKIFIKKLNNKNKNWARKAPNAVGKVVPFPFLHYHETKATATFIYIKK